MDRDKYRFATLPVEEFSPGLADRHNPAENGLSGGGAKTYKQLGMNRFHFGFEPGLTSDDLPHRRFLMQASFAPLDPSKMFDGVGDIYLVPRNTRFTKCLVEHTSRRSDKRMSLTIFHIAGLLADQNDTRMCRPFAENRLGRIPVEITSLARPSRLAQAFKIPALRKKFCCRRVLCFAHKPKGNTANARSLDTNPNAPLKTNRHLDRRDRFFFS